MKKTILFAIVAPLFVSSASFAASANMSNDELARVVCNHLQQNDEVKTAVSKAYSEVKTIINASQKSTLKELASGDIEAVNFCSNIQI